MSAAAFESLTPQQARTILAALAAAAAEPANAFTWREMWDAYARAEIGKLEAPLTQRAMGGHVVRLLGDRRVMETTSAVVRDYRAKRRADVIRGGCRGAGGHPSEKTINNEVILLLRLTRWAARQQPALIPVDPLASINRADVLVPVNNVRLNVVEDVPTKPLSLSTLLASAAPLDRAMVLVAHSSGIRRREMALLQMDWIDRRERLIDIPPGLSKGQRDRKRGRTTVISKDAIEAIGIYRATLPARAQTAAWVFVNARRRIPRPLCPDFFTHRFRVLQKSVGVDGPSGPTWLHDLRRSFITLARRRGTDAVAVMKLAGHTTLDSQERYHVESREETLGIRDRMERARAADLQGLRYTVERPEVA